jgi:hydroxyacylglutathione hydrolase
MTLAIVTLQLGPMGNNTYLLADSNTGQAAVIDPSFESETALAEIKRHGWTLEQIWLTHAHFDHIAGVRALTDGTQPAPIIGLHPYDLPLWKEKGGARLFGMDIDAGPRPTMQFEHGQNISLGSETLEVRHTPGHAPGHVAFYAAASAVLFCGDLIFYRGVGRTDLPGSDPAALLRSIREQVFTLPPHTRLLSGHGPETTVEEEIAENPFV